MANRKYDSFSSLNASKSDWIVPTRVLNLWRGYRKTGEPFKGFNLLLLDHKRSRVHAFVPYNLVDEFEPMIQIGNLYVLENFSVKPYTADDKFRCLRKKYQIVFNEETELTHMEENVVNVENCCFDFFDIADLPTLSQQNTYLTDVVGIMEEHEPIRKIQNRNGVIQSQIIFELTDGRSSVKVTFWDEFAKHFSDCLKQAQEYPIILIIGCGRVTTWSEQVIVTNVGATNFYINCNHRSVNELRKLLAQKKISTKTVPTENRGMMKFYKCGDISKLGVDHAERQIFCQVQLTNFQQVKTWFQPICTSCYAKTIRIENQDTCRGCQRIVPYPDNMFELYAIASDETGSILIILEEREVKKLIGKTVYEINAEGSKEEIFPTILNSITAKDYTLKIRVQMDNILKKSEFYMVTDIMQGFYNGTYQQQQTTIPHPIESLEAQPSSSNCTNGTVSTIRLT
ncbi:replication protein A 70 kDa DNA-binding subunit A-like [Daucus carota subsp. sativus]|uniref:replication protein A 70 kDa DNA-binding subunit A-like n=1 Tax=Daucus carota subsp. sativus TaxID=79200 RepID=UPI0007EFCCEE|nr:PREDICTED: replication protein A 70 kDa DNA-binding subunit A-like [Daucus carota subsp. sativus]